MDVLSYLLGKQAGGGGGANLQTKNVTVTSNGSLTINPDTGYDGLEKVNLTTNVSPNNQNKAITIIENKVTTVTPDTGYDGINSIEITTNIPASGLDWSAIGYDSTPQNIVDDYNYSVSVSENWTPAANLMNKFKNDKHLVYMPVVDTSIATKTESMFNTCTNLLQCPLLNTSNVTSMTGMFMSCSKLETIPPFVTKKVQYFDSFCSGCTNLKNVPLLNTSRAIMLVSMFNGVGKLLTNDSLNNILQMCINATSYNGTKTLATLGFSSSNYSAEKIQSLSKYQDFINAGWTIGY